MTVTRKRDTVTPRVFMHKTADIRGGVSVISSELGGKVLREGAILSEPAEGMVHVVKTGAVVAAVAAADTSLKLTKHHNFKVGDVVFAAAGGAAVQITAIDTSSTDYDTVTLDAALGAIAQGGSIAEGKAKKSSGAELKYVPQSVNGTSQAIEPESNLITDAWVIGVTYGNPVPSFVSDKLKGIINL